MKQKPIRMPSLVTGRIREGWFHGPKSITDKKLLSCFVDLTCSRGELRRAIEELDRIQLNKTNPHVLPESDRPSDPRLHVPDSERVRNIFVDYDLFSAIDSLDKDEVKNVWQEFFTNLDHPKMAFSNKYFKPEWLPSQTRFLIGDEEIENIIAGRDNMPPVHELRNKDKRKIGVCIIV